MSNSISVTAQGPGAARALEELFAVPGLVGEVRPRAEPRVVTRDGGLLASAGAIVGVVGGVASVVSNIIQWRETWKKAHESQRLSVVIEGAGGKRVSLDHATPEEIAAVLQSLES